MQQKWEALAAEEKQLEEDVGFLKQIKQELALSREVVTKKLLELNPQLMKGLKELKEEFIRLQELGVQDAQLTQEQQELYTKEQQLLEEHKEFFENNPNIFALIKGWNEQEANLTRYSTALQAQVNNFLLKKIDCMEEQFKEDKDGFEKQKQALEKGLKWQQEISSRLLLLVVFAVSAEILDRVAEYKFNYKLCSTTAIHLSSAIIVTGVVALQPSNYFSSSKNKEVAQEQGRACVSKSL